MNLTTTFEGLSTTLNKDLIKSKGLSEATVKAILKVHHTRLKTRYHMSQMNPLEEYEKLIKANQTIKECDITLQDLWGFEENEDYFRFWEVPYCLCPKLDNEDAYPTGYYVVNGNCPVHGDCDSSKSLVR